MFELVTFSVFVTKSPLINFCYFGTKLLREKMYTFLGKSTFPLKRKCVITILSLTGDGNLGRFWLVQ